MNASRFVNKNIIDALDHYQNYELHQKKLKQIKKELELKKQGKLKVIDEDDELLKLRVISNKLKNHEFNDSEKILEIQKSNQKLMQKMYEISQGKQSTLRNILDGQDYQQIQNALNAQQQQIKQMNQMSMVDQTNMDGSQLNVDQQQQQNITTQNDASQMQNTRHGSQHFISQISSTNNSHLKSLHMPLRKREATRIDEENQKMIERIMHANPSLPNKRLEQDYQNHLNIKKIIQKGNLIPVEKLLQKKQKYLEGVESSIPHGNALPPIEGQSGDKKDKIDIKPKQQRASSEIKTSRNHSGKKHTSLIVNTQQPNKNNDQLIKPQLLQNLDNNNNNTTTNNKIMQKNAAPTLKSVKSVSILQSQQQKNNNNTVNNNNVNGYSAKIQNNAVKTSNTITHDNNNNNNSSSLSQTQKIVPKSFTNRDIKAQINETQTTTQKQATVNIDKQKQQQQFQATEQTVKDQKYSTSMQKITQDNQPIKLSTTMNSKQQSKQNTQKQLASQKKNDDDYEEDQYSDFDNEAMEDSIIEEDDQQHLQNTNGRDSNLLNQTNKSSKNNTFHKDFNFKNFTSPTTSMKEKTLKNSGVVGQDVKNNTNGRTNKNGVKYNDDDDEGVEDMVDESINKYSPLKQATQNKQQINNVTSPTKNNNNSSTIKNSTTLNNIGNKSMGATVKSNKPPKEESIIEDDDAVQDDGDYEEEPFEENYDDDFDDN